MQPYTYETALADQAKVDAFGDPALSFFHHAMVCNLHLMETTTSQKVADTSCELANHWRELALARLNELTR